MDKERQELGNIEENRCQASQVINADIVFFAGLLQFKERAKERAKERVLHIVEESLERRLIRSQNRSHFKESIRLTDVGK